MTTPSPAKPRKSPRQARAQATVDAILDATAHILVRDGYAGASTNRVAERAGVSIGSLYQYFPNKAALVAALRRRHAGDMQRTLLAEVDATAGAPLEAVVARLVHAVVLAHQLNPALHRVLEEEVPQPVVRQEDGQLERQLCSLVESLLHRYPDILRVEDTALASLLLVRLVEALVHRAVLHPCAQAPLERMERELVTVVLRYVCGVERTQNR